MVSLTRKLTVGWKPGVGLSHRTGAGWNQGYATEAARVGCCDYAFGTLGLERFISLIRPVNLQSRRVAEKVGLTIEKEAEFRGLPPLRVLDRQTTLRRGGEG